jgi:hypothetical protein
MNDRDAKFDRYKQELLGMAQGPKRDRRLLEMRVDLGTASPSERWRLCWLRLLRKGVTSDHA